MYLLIPVSWVTPAVCPAAVQSAPRHHGRLTVTWCLPAPGACLWAACGELWAGGGGTGPRCFPSSLAPSGWGWPCQSWCCWGSVSLPVWTDNTKILDKKMFKNVLKWARIYSVCEIPARKFDIPHLFLGINLKVTVTAGVTFLHIIITTTRKCNVIKPRSSFVLS